MTANRWADVDRLYHQAVALPPAARAAFLAGACGDDAALRREVESLLAHDGDASFLSRPAATLGMGRTLHIGQTFGSYVISGRLGEGGMGEVYRARDTTLGRDVAIKVLPAVFAANPERLARFEREARLLAALNHPLIGAIYGVAESDGIRALVLELVEGPTLADRLARGPLPIAEALKIAINIADALEAAHEKGIIHRDLKPANIKVTATGVVKVLDFGLAKAAAGHTDTPGPDLSQSPTVTVGGTRAGVILGTAAYMSPEQARGQAVDKRSDIWAFGCVLYEMLTGRRAFPGEDVTETLAAVVRMEPDWSLLPADISSVLVVFLRRILQKDPRARVGDIHDVRLALEGAFEPTAPQATTTTPSSWRDARHARIVAAAAVLAAAALAIPTVRHLRETPEASESETRVDIVTPATADPTSFALSPDGRRIVFVSLGDDGVSRLWVRSLDSTIAHSLPGSDGASSPFWSPDSHSVGFFAELKLKRVDLGGGTPQTLASPAAARGGAWNTDGVILFTPATAASPLFRVPAAGGHAEAVTKLARQASHRFPVFLPGGRQFLFFAQETSETQGIYLGALDSSDTYKLTRSENAGVYLSPGWLLWVRAGTLVAQRLDLERKALTGDPVTLSSPVVFESITNASAISVSATGLVAYRAGRINRRQLTWFDRSGKALGTLGAADESRLSSPSLSPDGNRVAVHRVVEGNADIWIVDNIRTLRFTFNAAFDRYPIWSSDGTRIVFDSDRTGTRSLYQKSSTGAGAEDPLLESPQDKLANHVSPDGRFLLYQSIDPRMERDLWILPLEGGRKPWVFLRSAAAERFGQFSPDGRWVAYMSNESGHDEIYVRPFVPPSSGVEAPQSGDQWQVTTAGGVFPRWRADGKELYYIGPVGQMMAVPITAIGTTVSSGAAVTLFPTRIYGGGIENGLGLQYDVSRDGRFLINTVLDDPSGPITLLQHWRPEPKR